MINQVSPLEEAVHLLSLEGATVADQKGKEVVSLAPISSRSIAEQCPAGIWRNLTWQRTEDDIRKTAEK